MASEGRGGRIFLLLLIVLALAGGGGWWNYHRNLALELQKPRPFRSYSDGNLDSLEAAYRQEIEQLSASWETARTRRTGTRGHGLVGERADEFAAVQRVSAQTRALNRELADRRATMVQIEEEQGLRAGERDRVRVLLRRLLTF